VSSGLAIYGAVIATVALGWEIVRWWREREPRLLLEVSRSFVSRPHQGEQLRTAELLVREVRNLDSSGKANVTSIGWGIDRPNDRPFFRANIAQFQGATLPGVIEPNDAGVTAVVLVKCRNALSLPMFRSRCPRWHQRFP
jgi:hypothetical protein